MITAFSFITDKDEDFDEVLEEDEIEDKKDMEMSNTHGLKMNNYIVLLSS